MLVNTLKKYIEDNPDKNMTEIAQSLGISQSTVNNYIRKYNIPYIKKSKHWNMYRSERTKEIIKYMAENTYKSIESIAEYFNCSRQHINTMRKDIEIDRLKTIIKELEERKYN